MDYDPDWKKLIGSEIEECYYEYFSDIENYGTSIKSVEEFDNYGWCY